MQVPPPQKKKGRWQHKPDLCPPYGFPLQEKTNPNEAEAQLGEAPLHLLVDVAVGARRLATGRLGSNSFKSLPEEIVVERDATPKVVIFV